MSLFGQKQENKWDRFIGEKIKAAREERGMPQEELAKAVYKNRVTISDYERGRTEISAYDLMRIAQALGKPLMYFFPPLKGIREIQANELTDRERELLQFFRQIQNEEGEKLVIQQARKIADVAADLDIELERLDMKLNTPEPKKSKK